MNTTFVARLRAGALIVAIASLLSGSVALAQNKTAQVDQLMSTYSKLGQFNGAVLVAENGKVVYRKGFGYANAEWDIMNTPDTRFRLGSITKQFTAVLILQLVDEGKIKLDGTLAEYLPDYRKDTGEKVTITHLLNHTSGIPSYTGLRNFFPEISRNPYPVDEFVKKYCSGDLAFEPGSKFAYNNSGYFLLGAIIEKVTGKKYEQVLKERIFDPLGMKDSGYDHHATIMKRRAAAYERRPTGLANAPYLDMSLPYAAGSLYSTVEDLYTWDQALYGDKVLSAKSKELMFTPHLNNYAFGWVVNEMALGDKPDSSDKVKTIGHGGGINGFNTLIVRLVDDRHLIVLLNNTGGTRLGEMAQSIASILYGKPHRQPRVPISNVVQKTISEKGVAAAIAEYRELKSTRAAEFDFGESELNSLGYALLASEKIKDAIEVFKLNVEMYPKAFNTYDSLGEAYMSAGEKELAIANYRKSLELNPNNTGAVEALKKLEGK